MASKARWIACMKGTAFASVHAGRPSAKASLRAWKGWKPAPTCTPSMTMALGSLAATSSMSIPPCAEAMKTGASRERSTTIARYISREPARSMPCSTRTRRTIRPSGPVWWVRSRMPSMSFATDSASSAERASLTPPPLPRPPAWIWAFTTTGKPSSFAASTASSGV
jgi:hypothetical protein